MSFDIFALHFYELSENVNYAGGKGVPADRMARMMLEVFKDYILSQDFQKCLKIIRIVIFDKKMLETFVTEAKSTLDPTKASRKGFCKYSIFWFNFYIYCMFLTSFKSFFQFYTYRQVKV